MDQNASNVSAPTVDDSGAITLDTNVSNQRDFNESELSVLNAYILDSCATLLAVDRNFMNQQLHLKENQSMVKTFAQDKSPENRALVVAKVDPVQAAAAAAAEGKPLPIGEMSKETGDTGL